MKNISTTFPNGKKKVLLFSFDDGLNLDRKVMDIIEKYSMKGTFHINTDFKENSIWKSGKEDVWRIDPSHLVSFYDGHEIALHGHTHPFLSNMPRENILLELQTNKEILEDLTRKPVRGLSYPYSDCNQEIEDIVKILGIRYGRLVESGASFTLPQNPLCWIPTRFFGAKDIMETAKSFMEMSFNTLAVYCLAGHSYDYAREDSWGDLNKFCQLLSEGESIWYATCIEMFDYIYAAKELLWSVNCKFVTNPTTTTISLLIDNRHVVINSGETISL